MKKETVGLLQIFVASLLFGLIPIIVRFEKNIGPYSLSFFRVLISVISLILFCFFMKRKITPFKSDKKKMFLFGAIHGFIILGYFLAINYLSVASAILLLYSSSIWIVVFSYFILGDRVTIRTMISLLIAFVGLIFVASPQTIFLNESYIGLLSGLASGVGMGLVYVLSKTFKKYDKISLTFWQNLIGLPFVLPLFFFDIPKVITISDIGLVIILGTFLTTLPFVLLFEGFGRINAQKGSVVIMLDIVFSILFAWVLFQEVPTISIIFGGILIMIGTYSMTKKN